MGGGEEPGLLEVGEVVCDGRGGVDDPDHGLQLRPGIQDITNGEEVLRQRIGGPGGLYQK